MSEGVVCATLVTIKYVKSDFKVSMFISGLYGPHVCLLVKFSY